MNNSKKKRRFMTLIEIMIVMFLISIIAGMVTYKVKGSIDYGKAFKTHQKIVQMKQILELAAIQKGIEHVQVDANIKKILNRSLLSSKKDELLTDGWNEKWESIKVTVDSRNSNKINVNIVSKKFTEYLKDNDTWFEGEDN